MGLDYDPRLSFRLSLVLSSVECAATASLINYLDLSHDDKYLTLMTLNAAKTASVEICLILYIANEFFAGASEFIYCLFIRYDHFSLLAEIHTYR